MRKMLIVESALAAECHILISLILGKEIVYYNIIEIIRS